MIDGIYEGYINTPMGNTKGRVKLETVNGKLNGYIEALGIKNNFFNGTVKENICEFSGNIKYFLVNIEYTVKANIQANKLIAVANTNKGKFNIEAEKII